MEIIGSVGAVTLGVLEICAIWRWGFAGTVERIQLALNRIVAGPRRPPAIDVHQEIARLERELGMDA